MFELLNPFLLGGLAAVSAPVIIHLLHRRHAKRVDWGAMRFLLELLAKQRKRLLFEDLLLLLVRALIIGLIALMMLRPAWIKSQGQHNGDLARLGRTASVLLIDDSISSAAGRAQPAFEQMKKLALAYVESLAPGDEVSVRLMSQAGAPAADPVFDLESVKLRLAGLKPTSAASDIPALLEAGLDQLKRHVNPGAELVLVTDGRADGWHPQDQAPWDAVHTGLAGARNSSAGTRGHPNLMVLAPGNAAMGENFAITRIGADRSVVAAGQPSAVRVTVAHYGKEASRGATVQVSVDGQVIGSSPVEFKAGEEAEAIFPHTFEQPGSYGVEAVLADNQDLLPADDRRAMSLQVESSVPVLLVDSEADSGLRGKLGFLQYALDPDGQGRGAFKARRISAAQLTPAALEGCRVVVLGDARLLESSMVDALERFLVAGGGILVGLGPGTDPALVNRYWARGGEGFLPCPLGVVNSPSPPAIPASINFGHRVFSGFGTRNDDAWRNARIKSYYRLQLSSRAETEPLVTLDNGDALIVERRRGLGLVCLVATSLNADWCDLPLEAAYVPLLRGITGDLGSFVMPPRNLQPGEQIIFARLKDHSTNSTARGPRGAIKLSLGAWEGRDALISEPLSEPGLYELQIPGEPTPIRYAFALDPAESTLKPITRQEMARALGGSVNLLTSSEEVAQQLDPSRRRSVELWQWLLAAVVGLMFVETWLPRRALK